MKRELASRERPGIPRHASGAVGTTPTARDAAGATGGVAGAVGETGLTGGSRPRYPSTTWTGLPLAAHGPPRGSKRRNELARDAHRTEIRAGAECFGSGCRTVASRPARGTRDRGVLDLVRGAHHREP